MTCAKAIITASVGVPLTEYLRSPCFRNRIGRLSVSEWPAPDCSSAGATIHTSSERLVAIDSSTAKPGAWIDMKMRHRKRRRPLRTLVGSAAWWRDKHERSRRQLASGIDGSWFRGGVTASMRLVDSPY